MSASHAFTDLNPFRRARFGGNSNPPTRSTRDLYDHGYDRPQIGYNMQTADSQPTPDVMSPQDVIIAVMGITGSGKTTFVSRCVGEDVGIGHGLQSCTQDVAIHSFRRRGRVVRLIDTPGFDDTSKADANILNNIAFWLSHAYSAQPKLLLSGIIYLHPVSETRMAGTATKNLEMMKLVCGEESLSAIWLATTMWGLVSPEIGNRRERELMSTDQFWGSLVQHGSKVRRHQDSNQSAFAIIDDIINRHRPVVLRIQRQMVDENQDVDQTDAGKFLRRNVVREQEKVLDRLNRSARELDASLEAQNTAEVEEIMVRQQNYRRQLDEKSASLASIKLDMEKLRKEKAKELADREKAFAQEKASQDAKMAKLDQEVNELRSQRDQAVKNAEAAAQARQKLDEANLQLMLERDQANLARIDSVVAEQRCAEETKRAQEQVEIETFERELADLRKQAEQAAYAKSQVVKQEKVFSRTLKVSMAQMLVQTGFQYIIPGMCMVM